MKLSNDRNDFTVKLDRLHPRYGDTLPLQWLGKGSSGVMETVALVALLLAVYPFNLLFFGAPGLLLAAGGWLLARRVNNSWIRMCIQSGLLSFAVTPTPYGHAGLVPASLVVFFPPAGNTDWIAIDSLPIGWLVAFGLLALGRRWQTRRAS